MFYPPLLYRLRDLNMFEYEDWQVDYIYYIKPDFSDLSRDVIEDFINMHPQDFDSVKALAFKAGWFANCQTPV